MPTLFANSHEMKKLEDLVKHCKLLLVYPSCIVPLEIQRLLVACNLPSMVNGKCWV